MIAFLFNITASLILQESVFTTKSDIDKTDWFIQKPSNVFMVGKLFEKFLEKEKGLNLEGCGTLISKKGLECRDLEFSYFGKHYTLSINDGGAA